MKEITRVLSLFSKYEQSNLEFPEVTFQNQEYPLGTGTVGVPLNY